MFLITVERVAKSVVSDQTPQNVASDLGLHYLLRYVRVLMVNYVWPEIILSELYSIGHVTDFYLL